MRCTNNKITEKSYTKQIHENDLHFAVKNRVKDLCTKAYLIHKNDKKYLYKKLFKYEIILAQIEPIKPIYK